MSKEYLVKTSELFKIPGNKVCPNLEDEIEAVIDNREALPDAKIQHEEPANEEHTKNESAANDELTLENEILDQKLNSANKNNVVELPTNSKGTQRPEKRSKRQAAIKFEHKMKEILPCLKVKTKETPCLHGWIYEDWLKEIDDDPFDEVVAASVTTGVNIEESDPSESNSEAPEDGISILSPLGQVLRSLDDISFQHPEADDRIQHTPLNFLQMFPPAEEEMTWDNSTTPPALLKISEEDADDELNSALTKTKLFDSDEDFMNIDDLTSQDSDDVFFDDSILEVSLNGRRKFSRGNPLRRQLDYKKKIGNDDSNQYETEQRDVDDEYDEELDDLEPDDRNENLNISMGRPKSQRQRERVNYALLHSTGRKKKKK